MALLGKICQPLPSLPNCKDFPLLDDLLLRVFFLEAKDLKTFFAGRDELFFLVHQF